MNNNEFYKVCNPINCFYSNTYLVYNGEKTYTNDKTQCKLCAYDYKKLSENREFLRHEMRRFPKKSQKKFFTEKIAEGLIKLVTFCAGIVILIYIFGYIKLLTR